MSLYDYRVSRDLAAADPPFNALIMAAMRKADTYNLDTLRIGFPDVWLELNARYNAPGGQLPGEAEMGSSSPVVQSGPVAAVPQSEGPGSGYREGER